MAGHQSHQGYAEIEDTFRSTQEQAETPQPDQLELLLAVELHYPNTVICPSCKKFHALDKWNSYYQLRRWILRPLSTIVPSMSRFDQCAAYKSELKINHLRPILWKRLYAAMKAYRHFHQTGVAPDMRYFVTPPHRKKFYGAGVILQSDISSHARIADYGHLILKTRFKTYGRMVDGLSRTPRWDSRLLIREFACPHWKDFGSRMDDAFSAYLSHNYLKGPKMPQAIMDDIVLGRCAKCPTEYHWHLKWDSMDKGYLIIDIFRDLGSGLPNDRREWKALKQRPIHGDSRHFGGSVSPMSAYMDGENH